MAHVYVHPHATERGLRLAGTLGMAVLPVFAVVVVLLTWLEWDFLHRIGWTVLDADEVNYPSSLARGDFGVVQALNFLMIGVFTVILGQGLRTQFVHRWSGAVAVFGFCAVGLAGVLSAFATDLPSEEESWHGLAHGIGFLLLLFGCGVTFIASGLALRGAPGWKGYWVYSLLNYPLAIAVSVVLSAFGQVSFYGLVAILLAWYGVMGMRLRQRAIESP
jgi:hypothetical protein